MQTCMCYYYDICQVQTVESMALPTHMDISVCNTAFNIVFNQFSTIANHQLDILIEFVQKNVYDKKLEVQKLFTAGIDS